MFDPTDTHQEQRHDSFGAADPLGGNHSSENQNAQSGTTAFDQIEKRLNEQLKEFSSGDSNKEERRDDKSPGGESENRQNQEQNRNFGGVERKEERKDNQPQGATENKSDRPEEKRDAGATENKSDRPENRPQSGGDQNNNDRPENRQGDGGAENKQPDEKQNDSGGDSHKDEHQEEKNNTGVENRGDRPEEKMQEIGGNDQKNNQQEGQSNSNGVESKDGQGDQKPTGDNQKQEDGDHNHGGDSQDSSNSLHLDPAALADVKELDPGKVGEENNLKDSFEGKGDFLDGGGGTNTVIGAGGNDTIAGNTEGAFNTITTGPGKDSIILGKEATNRVFDFDPENDRFLLDGLKAEDIQVGQGQNPTKGGLEQPLDSVNNTVVLDKDGNHILASLPFVKSGDVTEKNFEEISQQMIDEARQKNEGNSSGGEQKQESNHNSGDGHGSTEAYHDSNQGDSKQSGGDGGDHDHTAKDNGVPKIEGDYNQMEGTKGSDVVIGGEGDDFIAPGDDSFKFNLASAKSGADEFPFANDSKGSSDVQLKLEDGVLKAEGEFRDFQGKPLFSQGETTIDPNAEILNGSDPVSLINGFLAVPEDVEGNLLSGSHLHFSPSGDDRGSFADATVVRFLDNSVNGDGKSGNVNGEFKLTPEEQAALLAGNIYLNIHTNVPTDPNSGKAGFPTGENRINFNQNVVQFV